MPNLVAELAKALDEAGRSLRESGDRLQQASTIVLKIGEVACVTKAQVDVLVRKVPQAQRASTAMGRRIKAAYRSVKRGRARKPRRKATVRKRKR